MNRVFTVRILSPKACVWETKEAIMLSAENSAGVFDILPDHSRFMSIIRDVPITVQLSDATQQTFTYSQALLSCADNSVVIYIQ